MCMATKTISITEEAYTILQEKKKTAESFSEVIVRLSGKMPLASFFGALSPSSGEALAKEIKDTRRVHALAHAKRVKRYDF